MLYDKRRSGPVVIPCEGLTVEDLESFCNTMALEFYSVGTPEDWDDLTVFRAGTIDFPSRGCNVRFEKVLEWKAACAAIGPQVTMGGLYRHYKGGLYSTICDATEEATLRSVIVYRHQESNAVWTRPRADFFSVANDNGKLVPRFAYVGDPVK